MYGISTLKTRREAVGGVIPCPVRGCGHVVPPQPGVLRLTPEYKCPVHKLYLSETFYAHEKETDNLLWTDKDSLTVLRASRGERPAPSLGLETSDDALLWNAFRWLEVSGRLPGLLEHWSGRQAFSGKVAYWGFDRDRDRLFDPLRHARSVFKEPEDDPSEPGFLVQTRETLFLLVARALTSGPGRREPAIHTQSRWKEYEENHEGWARKVLARSCLDLAAEAATFELLRLWLLGSWMAAQEELDFVLMYLTPAAWGEGALEPVLPRLRGGQNQLVVKASWEDLWGYVRDRHEPVPGAAALLSYLAEKSAGYGRDGLLRRAFSLPASQVAAA